MNTLAFSVGKVVELVTPKGIRVWFLEDHSLPLIYSSFSFIEASASYQVAGKEAIPDLLALSLARGPASMTTDEFLDRLSSLAAGLSFSSTQESLIITMTATRKHIHESLELLKKTLQNPTFDPSKFKTDQQQCAVQLLEELSNPMSVGGHVARRTLFSNHPYGRVQKPENIASITFKNLKDYMARFFRKDALRVVVVGDAQPSEVTAWVDEAFGYLPTKKISSALPNPQTFWKQQIFCYTIAAPQTLFGLFGESPQRFAQDWMAFQLLLNFLGEGMDSKLMIKVRDEKSLAYTISTQHSSLNYVDFFAIVGLTKNETISQTLLAIYHVLQEILSNGVTQEELTRVQQSFLDQQMISCTSLSGLLAFITQFMVQGYTVDSVNNFDSWVRSVTPEQVHAVAKRYLEPEGLVTFLIGEQKGVEVQVLPAII